MTSASLKRIDKNIEKAFEILNHAQSSLARFVAVCNALQDDLGYYMKGEISKSVIRAERASQNIEDAAKIFENAAMRIEELLDRAKKSGLF